MHLGIIVMCCAVAFVLVCTLSTLGYIAIQEDKKYQIELDEARRIKKFMKKYQEHVRRQG